MKKIYLLLLLANYSFVFAQTNRWQQKVNYEMNIDFDVNTNQFVGTQKLTYSNNSPDTLHKVFYHLYFNAFQPNSMMDVRSRSIADPDPRVRSRISKLSPEEIGYQKIKSLKHNGKDVKFEVVETILEVTLTEAILPNSKAVLEMNFEAQVPLQVRRTGRDNAEGVRYSVAQWYPKLCEYDYEGWHSNPYIAREFHGVWGDFDVKISIDNEYVVGGTGYLQNADQIGHGYSNKKPKTKKGEKLTWHFKAPNVHDFMWAADPDFAHDIVKVDKDLELHFFYQKDTLVQNWKDLQNYAVECFKIMNQRFGRYPYKQYSFIQGGDGGMEYPMATLIVGHQSLRGLISVSVHEAIHSWFQHLLGTNESKYAWMDEGFTSYAQDEVMNELLPPKRPNPHLYSFAAYQNVVKNGLEEPATTHSDHYHTNQAYNVGSYAKGALALDMLNYIVGKTTFEKAMKRYFNEWKFKHPNPTDFKRIIEKESGLELDWFFENWIGTTKTIDYGIKNVTGNQENTQITLERVGQIPMPLDVVVSYKDGKKETFYIPLQLMRGEKTAENANTILLQDWAWVFLEYQFEINRNVNDILSIEIDPSLRMADIDRSNNAHPTPAIKFKGGKK